MASGSVCSTSTSVTSNGETATSSCASSPLSSPPMSPMSDIPSWPRSMLMAGEELSGERNYLRSHNGRYEAVFTSDGAVEAYYTAGKATGDRSVIVHSRRFRSHRSGQTSMRWRLTLDGQFICVTANEELCYSTGAQGVQSYHGPSRLQIRNDGNVVLYHGDDPVWRTTTGEQSHWSVQYLYAYEAKRSGLGLLREGSTIFNGDYLAKLEFDGRLCVYQLEQESANGVWKCEKQIWCSKPGPRQAKSSVQPFRLFVQNDGEVVIRDGNNTVVWRTRTSNKCKQPPVVLQMTSSGRLQLKDGNGIVLWSSTTS